MKLRFEYANEPHRTRLLAGNEVVEGVALIRKEWRPGQETRYVIEIYAKDVIEVPSNV